MSEMRPRVGVGAYVLKDGKVLFGKRKGGHGNGTWCAPGGKLDFNEDPVTCAIRETREEAGIEIKNVRFLGITNDVDHEAGSHYITLAYVGDWESGEARVMEPEKCSEWEWFDWDALPEPLYISTRNFLKNGYNPLTI